jgi:hypothetical protein
MRTLFATGSTKIDFSGKFLSKGGHLLRIFSQADYEIVNKSSADLLVAFDHNAKSYRSFIKSGGNPQRAFLVRLEPPAVFPSQYKKRVEELYFKIFTPGWIDSGTGQVNLGWVYRYDEDPVNPGESPTRISDRVGKISADLEVLYEEWSKRTILLSMVTGNKVSPLNEANYKIRRKIACDLGRDLLDVYGVLWKSSLYTKIKHRAGVLKFSLLSGHVPNLWNLYGDLFNKYKYTHGQIENKQTVLENSKFSIISENSNKYISEKLFDALISGTIPLYIGPDLKKSGLPIGIAIQISGTSSEIVEIINTLSEFEIRRLLANGRAFLTSGQFLNRWTEESVYKLIAEEIKSSLSITQTP